MTRPVLFLLLFISITAASCSKDKSPAKKLTDEIKGTIWTGELKYDGRPVNEPYSLYFDDKGNIEWNEWSGVYAGTYTVNNGNRSIEVIFASGSSFTATVSEDNKLRSFENGAVYDWNILDGQLYTAGETPLSGTWTASVGGNSITFTSPASLQINGSLQEYLYSRRHGSIRFGFMPQYYFFGIVTGESIKGIYSFSSGAGTSYATWQVNNF